MVFGVWGLDFFRISIFGCRFSGSGFRFSVFGVNVSYTPPGDAFDLRLANGNSPEQTLGRALGDLRPSIMSEWGLKFIDRSRLRGGTRR